MRTSDEGRRGASTVQEPRTSLLMSIQLLLSCVSAVALASSDPSSTCAHGSLCTTGSAVNITNVTGTDPVHGAGLCDAAPGNPPLAGH